MGNDADTQTSVNDSATCASLRAPVTHPRSADVLHFKIKVPQTLDQAAKLRKWLESILHTLTGRAYRFASNIVYQIKGAETQEDIDRLQPFIAYQAQRLAEASR
ncbi:hypothetical protein ABIF07_001095 [Bradyrhizobium elkanii]|uniref:hypothetical protein n=1 Tax=Bradyrhizobium elkanii TaxID=29448 RepID=UPI0021689199|nr:hypothetical protein [Bradyrhizobium elkanii]MCS3691989.1 hypothetical protein [Bradyrhizobium elkanii]